MHFPMDANWFLLTEGVTHAAAPFASAHTTYMRDPFGFLFQASMLVVLLCRSLIKILKVNQFVCLLPRGLSPFTPHFSKILKKVQFRDLHLIDAKHLKCSVCWLKKVLKYFKKVSHYFTFLELSESFCICRRCHPKYALTLMTLSKKMYVWLRSSVNNILYFCWKYSITY